MATTRIAGLQLLLFLLQLASFPPCHGHFWTQWQDHTFGVRGRDSVRTDVDAEYEQAERAIFRSIHKAERRFFKAVGACARSAFDRTTAKAIISRLATLEAEQDDQLLRQALAAADEAVVQAVEKEVTTIFHDLHNTAKLSPTDEVPNKTVPAYSKGRDMQESTPMKAKNTERNGTTGEERNHWGTALDKHKLMDDFMESLDLKGCAFPTGWYEERE